MIDWVWIWTSLDIFLILFIFIIVDLNKLMRTKEYIKFLEKELGIARGGRR